MVCLLYIYLCYSFCSVFPFVFFWRHGRNFTLNNYYYDVSLSPRQVVWQCRKMSLFELASSACNGPMTKVQKQHIYWEVASTYIILKQASVSVSEDIRRTIFMYDKGVTFSSVSDVWNFMHIQGIMRTVLKDFTRLDFLQNNTKGMCKEDTWDCGVSKTIHVLITAYRWCFTA